MLSLALAIFYHEKIESQVSMSMELQLVSLSVAGAPLLLNASYFYDHFTEMQNRS